jgi:lysyl-tRNA synthetase class 2
MEKDLINERYIKLKKLQDLGIDPFPAVCLRTHTAMQVRENEKELTNVEIKPRGDAEISSRQFSSKDVTVAGRIMLWRPMGKATFATIEDESGRIQVYFKFDDLKKTYHILDLFDIGDIIECTGSVFRTKKGELTIHVKDFRLLTKTLRPLPDKFHGLEDIETRYRERYLDFMTNPKTREIVRLRSQLLKSLRKNLDEAGFIEVETPILQALAGGAIAKPFQTHYNAYDTDVFLRIAPELYLKRLVIGGFEKVYELGRNFRNEGVDWSHNPEFTMLEFYQAYSDYEKLMNYTKDFLQKVCSDLKIKSFKFEGNEVPVGKGWQRIAMRDAIYEETKIDIDKLKGLKLYQAAVKLGLKDIKKDWGKGKIVDEIFKEKVRPKLIEPTFIIHHPIELSPLAKKLNNKHVQRFQLIILGIEIVNAYSELNDPVDQTQRFLDQAEIRGTEETMQADTEYIKALEYGLPPTAGWGMGVDRLMLLLTGAHTVREIIAFPYMRPKK